MWESLAGGQTVAGAEVTNAVLESGLVWGAGTCKDRQWTAVARALPTPWPPCRMPPCSPSLILLSCASESWGQGWRA